MGFNYCTYSNKKWPNKKINFEKNKTMKVYELFTKNQTLFALNEKQTRNICNDYVYSVTLNIGSSDSDSLS